MNTEQNKKLEDAILAQFETFLKKEEQFLAQEQAGTDEAQVEQQLKWFTAYVLVKAVCGEIIAPYCPDTDLVIDRFWETYRVSHHQEEEIPAIGSFFEWYCYDNEVFNYMR